MTTLKEWIYKNGEKVYVNRAVVRNEDVTDYEMENIIAEMHYKDRFDEDEYYNLKWERFYQQN